MLSSIKLRISSFELSDEEDQSEQEKSLRYLDELIQRMREISFNLMPNKLIRYGLIAAVEEFIEYCNKGNPSLKINFRYEEGLQFTEQQSINLYRIAQEIIHNTIKHAEATLLKLELRKEKTLSFLQA